MEQHHVGANQMPQWVVPPARPSVVTTYLHKHSKIVGVALMVCGLLSVVFNVIEITTSKNLASDDGHGIWSGILMLVAGIMGLASGICRTRCKITGFMVMSILAACSSLLQLIFGVRVARLAHEFWLECIKCRSDAITSYPSYDSDYFDCIYVQRHGICIEAQIRTVLAMEVCLAITAIIGGISAIWGSAICCKAVGCCSNNLPVWYAMPYTTPMAVSSQQNGAQTMFSPYTVLPTAPAADGSVYQPANVGEHAVMSPAFQAPPTYVSAVSQLAYGPK